MTDPFLDNCGGWTPAPDMLTRNERFGFEGAYLWGRLRRLCQIEGGTCVISHEALGNRIGMSRRTVIKYLDRLIEDGYVEDLDAGVKNRAHAYSVKKGEAKILSGMQISHTDDDTIPQKTGLDVTQDTTLGMRNLHTNENEYAEIAQSDGQGVQISHTDYAENAHQEAIGMQNLHLKRDSSLSLEESNPSITPNNKSGGQKPRPPRPDMIPVEKIFVEEMKKHCLNKAQIEVIQETVGLDPPALDRWRESVRAWNLNGNKPTDAAGMLDWFKTGKRSNHEVRNGAYQNGRHKPTKIIPATGEQAERLKRMAAAIAADDTG